MALPADDILTLSNPAVLSVLLKDEDFRKALLDYIRAAEKRGLIAKGTDNG